LTKARKFIPERVRRESVPEAQASEADVKRLRERLETRFKTGAQPASGSLLDRARASFEKARKLKIHGRPIELARAPKARVAGKAKKFGRRGKKKR
jgi:hypothetical protein